MKLVSGKIIASFCFLLISFGANAQKNLKDQVLPLIQSNQLTKAESVVDNALKENPKLVDGWMLKGNLQYFKYNNTVDMLSLTPNLDESVYDNSIGEIGPSIMTIPKDVADSCIRYFKIALGLDSSRADIHAGICYILSISIQPEALINYLPVLKRQTKLSGNDMRDYAFNMIDRERIDEGMKVFEGICNLYPDDGNLFSDMAAEYYTHGQIDKAKKFIDTSLVKNKIDEITYGNAFFLYSVAQDQLKAKSAIYNQSKLLKDENYKMYEALVDMYNNNVEWKTKALLFAQEKDNSSPLKHLATFLTEVPLSDSKATYDTILAIGLHDGYNMILFHYLYNQYPKSFEAKYSYAEVLTHTNQFEEAIKIYKTILKLPADSSATEQFHLYYGWALYKLGKYTDANVQWESLTTSHNFYYKSAACYFLGKYYKEQGDKKRAKAYFELITNDTQKSKYVNFCDALLKRMY